MRRAAIFHLGRREEVGVSPGPNVAGYETHRVPSYDLDTPSDALENQIGPSVWYSLSRQYPSKLKPAAAAKVVIFKKNAFVA